MKKYTLILIFLFTCTKLQSQDFITIPKHIVISGEAKNNIILHLDSLYKQIIQGEIDTSLIDTSTKDFTLSVLKKLQKYELKKDSLERKKNDKQIINIYPISSNKYSISVAYVVDKEEKMSILPYVFRLIADDSDNKVTFSVPLHYLTRHWKNTKIGNITYLHQKKLNKEQAIIFDKKNTEIATLFGIEAEKMVFYMCESYEEIMKLTGFEYSYSSNGLATGGYGVTANTIFMNHEDFSHDVFHYYSGLVNKRVNRNWIAEEGAAYTLGNAYYTDKNGKMTTQKRLIKELESYMVKNKDTTLWTLFEKDYPIFNHIANDLSVRSVISSIIFDEIMLQKGKRGVLQLVNSGGGKNEFTNYMNAISKLIDINKENFDKKVTHLMNKEVYK